MTGAEGCDLEEWQRFLFFFAKIAWCICYTLVGRWNNLGRNLVVMFQIIGVGQVKNRESVQEAPNTSQLSGQGVLEVASGALPPGVLDRVRAELGKLREAGGDTEPTVSTKIIVSSARAATKDIG